MSIQDVIKLLLDEMQEAHRKEDIDKVQELANHIIMVKSHCDLFESVMSRIGSIGKEMVLQELHDISGRTRSLNITYGMAFKSVEEAGDDIDQVIDFVNDCIK